MLLLPKHCRGWLKDAPAYSETLSNLAPMVQDLQSFSNALLLLSAVSSSPLGLFVPKP